jgi:hypothetical protein
MLDPRPVAQQAMQGGYPQNWRVYYGNGNIESGIAIVFWVITGVNVVGLLWCWLAGLAWLAEIPWLWVVPSFFCIGAFGLGRTAASKKRSLFVLHPEGVVICYDGKLQNLTWLSFPAIRKLEYAQRTSVRGARGYTHSWQYNCLDVYLTNGAYLKWEMNDDFGDVEASYKSIIAAYLHYQAKKAPNREW